MIGSQDFVAIAEPKRAGNDISAHRSVGDKDDIVRAGINVCGKRLACFAQHTGGAPAKELDRLRLSFALQSMVMLEYASRAGAERTMIEKCNVGPNQE